MTVTPFLPNLHVLPLVAPLSADMAAHLVAQQTLTDGQFVASPLAFFDLIQRYVATWTTLGTQIPSLRRTIDTTVTTHLQSKGIPTRPFIDLVQAASPSESKVSVQTLAKWRHRHLLRGQYGHIDRDCATAILLARHILPEARRDWLPPQIAPAAPWWWCWQYRRPTDPPQPCPIPLPPDLPPATVLHTPWSGAAALTDWQRIPPRPRRRSLGGAIDRHGSDPVGYRDCGITYRQPGHPGQF
ncbi:MAG: hypothetical protein HC828_05950 [Blastochloris sp.]|nr:hypothetical protein [Blastochloris sp.]